MQRDGSHRPLDAGVAIVPLKPKSGQSSKSGFPAVGRLARAGVDGGSPSYPTPDYLLSSVVGLGELVTLESNPLSGATAATAFLVCSQVSDSASQGSPVDGWGSDTDLQWWPNGGSIYCGWGSTSRFGPIAYPAGSLDLGQVYTIVSGPGLWSLSQGRTVLFTTSASSFGSGSGPCFIGSDPANPWSGVVTALGVYLRLLDTDDHEAAYANFSGLVG